MRIAIALSALVLALTGCADVTSSSSASTTDDPPLQAAYDSCSDSDGTLDVGDDGHSLFSDTGAEGKLTETACVLLAIDTPDRIVNEMDSTTALMGRQSAEDGDFTYEWSYHPDNGMNLVIADQ